MNPMNDAQPRPDALFREQFTLTIDDVILIYERAEFLDRDVVFKSIVLVAIWSVLRLKLNPAKNI